MKTRKPRSGRRGLTLLEAVFSILVLAIGVVAIFGMVSRISNANQSMAFQATALDAFARIAAEIRDSTCVYNAADPQNAATAQIDPGLSGIAVNPPVNLPRVWQTAPVGAASLIQHVGTFNNTSPPIQIAYHVTNAPPDSASLTEAPSYDIDVRVRQIMNDPVMDAANLESGYWIQVYPVKKICSLRADDTSRGEYFP